jgi:uncharacterized protein (TIGR00251 family)
MPIATDIQGATLIRVKAVPGAKRDQIVGRLGDRLKVRVAQPPEGGKANRAICELLATELHLKPRAASIASGESSAEKVVRIEGITAAAVEAKWP